MKCRERIFCLLFITGIGLVFFKDYYIDSYNARRYLRNVKALALRILKKSPENAMQQSLEYEIVRRKVDRVSQEFWIFLKSELDKLRKRISKGSENNSIDQLLADSADYQIMLRKDFHNLSQCAEELAIQPSLEHDVARKNIDRVFQEFWIFLKRELNKLKTHINKGNANNSIDQLLADSTDYQMVLRNDFNNLANDIDNLANWRFRESIQLGDLVQRRLEYLQNPSNCKTARKLVCDLSVHCGFGCRLHLATYCMIIAYATERTMVLDSKHWNYNKEGWETMYLPLSNTCTEKGEVKMVNWNDSQKEDIQVVKLSTYASHLPFLPLAVPDDLADRLVRFHGNPSVWWIGQFVKYLTRPNKQTAKRFAASKNNLGFQRPVVGVHIRRTDKLLREAAYHGIEEYMQAVDEWFTVYEKRHGNVTRRVYLATDSPSVLEQAKKMYMKYTFISDTEMTGLASQHRTRFTDVSLRGIVQDIHFLSHCDFVVCTFTSNVGRAVYELMQTLHGDASQKAISLDDIYSFHGQNTHYVEAVESHKARQDARQIELHEKDLVSIRVYHWDKSIKGCLRNGYSNGTNKRTGATGLFPSYKVIDTVKRVKMPVYPNVTKL